jgi:anthranilate phosphoribosyltransferase
MKYVQPVRKSLGFRTVFNILGPLANPAGAAGQVMGVPEAGLMPIVAEALHLLGVKRAMIVHSDGLDEISTMGPTRIMQLKAGKITESMLNPGDYGIKKASLDDLQGGDAKSNAQTVRNIISGNQADAKKDIVVLNAAAAIIVAGLADDFVLALKIAEKSIETGKAIQCLENLVAVSTLSLREG